MNKPEVIYLAERNAIDLFAPERAGPPPRREVTVEEPLQDFAAEVLISPTAPVSLSQGAMRSAVPFRSRSRVQALAALASIGLVALVAVSFVVWLWGGAGSLPAAPSEQPAMTTASSSVTPELPPVLPRALPPVLADNPPPVTAAPAPTEAAPAILSKDPPSRGTKDFQSGGRLQAAPKPAAQPAAVRLERPLSQDPGRLVEVPTPLPPPNPSPPVTVSPPAATPAPAPAAASLSAEVPPPAAPPTPAAAPPAAPSVSAIESSTAAIRNTLARYEQAFTALDANAARAVWPTVNARTLSRAFDRLEEQEIAFEGCQIRVADARAEATCQGTARYVPRIGDRTPRVDRRQWNFSLVRTRDEWLIGAVDAR